MALSSWPPPVPLVGVGVDGFAGLSIGDAAGEVVVDRISLTVAYWEVINKWNEVLEHDLVQQGREHDTYPSSGKIQDKATDGHARVLRQGVAGIAANDIHNLAQGIDNVLFDGGEDGGVGGRGGQ